MSSEQSSEESVVEPKKRRRIPVLDSGSKIKPKHKQVVINVSMTKYDVVSDVAESLDWRVQCSRKKGDWDLLWVDTMIEPQTLLKMHFFQKISHFPGIHVLARKNLLGLSFMEMSRQFPSNYNFFPRTWNLPADYPQFRQAVESSEEEKCYIVKPEASCQGKGIFLTFKTQDVENGKHYVVQEYIERPFLVEGLKFDFRVYVLLCGTNPMRLYIYEEGLARLATEKYEHPNKNNLKRHFMHLTNYAINKKNPKFIYNNSAKNMAYGHKRSLTSVLKSMQRRGLNVALVKEKLNDVIVKTMILGQPLVSHQYKFSQPDDEYRQMCFHILGIDIMIDEMLNPVVIEINHTPSFATDTPLDYQIKFNLIKDTLVLLNINEETKKQLIAKTNNYQRERVTNGKRLIETEEQKQKIKTAQLERDRYENEHLGRYTKIYPVDDPTRMKEYQQYFKAADKTYFSENNFIRMEIEKAQQEKTKSPLKIFKRKESQEHISPIKSSFLEKELHDQMQSSSPDLTRREMKMSSLLQQPHHQITPYIGCFPTRKQKPNFGASSYLKMTKSIGELEVEQMKNSPQQIAHNLPKIECRSPTKSSTIEIKKHKYLSMRKRSIRKKEEDYSEDKQHGAFLKAKVIQFDEEVQEKRPAKNANFAADVFRF